MMQPSDNELDKLISEAADKYQSTGAKPDWEVMQALLDKHMPAGKEPRVKGFILVMLLLFLLGGTYLYFAKNSDKTSLPVKEQQGLINPVNSVPFRKVNPIPEGTNGNIGQKLLIPILQNKETIKKQNETTLNKGNHLQKNNIRGNIRVSSFGGEIAENNHPLTTENVALSADKNRSANTINDSTADTSLQNQSTGIGNNLSEKTPPAEVVIVENKVADATKNTRKKNTAKRKYPFEFSLLYAPELTTIRFSNIDKPGSNYGLLIGYAISKNLTIQTGIIKSKKNYIASGKDFAPGYPPPTNAKLNKVDGYCIMYEIPLNLKSKISGGKKFNLFYTAGISSYFMKKESYTSYYSSNWGEYTKNAQYNSQQNYWLSLATFGLGLEKQLTPHFNIAAAPFIKIPFKGMGHGNLKLLSTGINFSLSYKPSFLKK